MSMLKVAVPLLTVAILQAGSAREAGAVGRFGGAKNGTVVSAVVTATGVGAWGATDCSSFYSITHDLSYSCTCDNYIGQTYDSEYYYHEGCYAYKRVDGYITNTPQKDVIFYFQVTDLPSNKVQRLAFGEDSSNHVAVCSQSMGTTCQWIRHNTASPSSVHVKTDYGIDNIDGASGTGTVLLGSLNPGVTGYEPGREDKGSIKSFTPTDSQLQATISRNIITYPPSVKYQIGGYSKYKTNAMCSQFIADSSGANCTEGRNRTYISTSTEGSIASSLYNYVKSQCKDQGDLWIGYAFVPVFNFVALALLDSTCSKLASQVVNTFQSDPGRDNGFPLFGMTIKGLTSPDDFYSTLSGITQSTMASCSTVELGRIALWSGKVNLHQSSGGTWTTDSDCSSGSTIAPLTYCRKFWPGTVSVTSVPTSSKSVWKDAGCGGGYTSFGSSEYTCNPF